MDGGSNILAPRKIEPRDNIHSKFSPRDGLYCYGICDGLFCMSSTRSFLNSDSPISIWNPIVKKVRRLPRLKRSWWDNRPSYLCFGHHNGDYKVISVIPLGRAYEVHIYSLSQDRRDLLVFNKSRCYADKFDLWPYVKARFVNGAAYFVRSKELGRRVVCFDLSSKIIRKIKLPGDCALDYFSMEESQDSIALIEKNRNGDVVMWGLRVSDNSYLWNKKFIIEQITPAMGMRTSIGAMGFLNKDNLVLWMIGRYSGLTCLLYNRENDSARRLRALERYLEEVDKRRMDDVRLYDFTVSLVLLAISTTFQKMQQCSANEENQKSRKRKRI